MAESSRVAVDRTGIGDLQQSIRFDVNNDSGQHCGCSHQDEMDDTVTVDDDVRSAIEQGRTTLGIEFGSTRIKAVLIGEDHLPLAVGSHSWENQFVDRLWTYSLDSVRAGLQDCYASLAADVRRRYGIDLTTVGALGISAHDARLSRPRRRRTTAGAVPHLAQHQHRQPPLNS